VTFLIVRYYHDRYAHQNNELVLNEVRQKFWIPDLRVVLKKVRNSCQFCKNYNAKPSPPEMGNLPSVRLTPYVRPFVFTGLDYFGPVEVSVGRHREKRWVALFTCLTVRAIHLEVVETLTTDDCILALKRFIARRGIPREIYSDNGTYFRGANKELQNSLKCLDYNKLSEELTHKGLVWKFIPVAASHMGGIWERLVQSVKRVLRVILYERAPKQKSLLSFLLEAESMINSRPLTHVALEVGSDECLTPNHFLLGNSNGYPPTGNFAPSQINIRSQWHLVHDMSETFWKRWIKEYLPTLTRRCKWFDPVKPIEVGDVVLIVDSNSSRNNYPKGIVIKTYPGKDGQVRSVDVRCRTGVYNRPVVKIAVLDVLHKNTPER
jgi:transposase InsO family protein